jgi:hypothetical protein
VQLGLFFRGDLFGAERRKRDLVGGEELQRQHEQSDHDDYARGGTRSEEGAYEDHIHEPEQKHRQEHSRLQATVFAEVGASLCHRGNCRRSAP